MPTIPAVEKSDPKVSKSKGPKLAKPETQPGPAPSTESGLPVGNSKPKGEKPQAENSERPKPVKGAKASPTPKPKGPERPVIYESVKSKLFLGEEALAFSHAKKILGWQEESENIKFSVKGPSPGQYLFVDRSGGTTEEGKKISCVNNVANRPLDLAKVETLIQEILRKKWSFNGEPVIIGRTGIVLNGQHQLVALCLANQIWLRQKDKWADYWTSPPTIEKLVVLGVDESDRVVNTMDTCKPRSLQDVLYRSEYFSKLKKPGERKEYAKRTTAGISMLWYRTGAKENAFAPIRTHSESLDFLGRHPRLLECVKHISEEDSEKHLTRYLSPGYAAALLYLQGSALTEREKKDGTGYTQVEFPTEALLNWELWDKAQEFWVLIASENEQVNGLKEALGTLLDQRGSLTVSERMTLLIKAWNYFADGDPIDPANLSLKYRDLEDGGSKLDENPNIGGIDVGGM